ncbi:MAG: low molecular weight protein-tyrosine-phosphatase [Eubacteriales bacterium]|nr:low molecular weight protein-tyrosine-phosphatase [Eubacteriales bacterium]
MIKILFICHGNICRSPMAEYVMRDLINREGRAGEFYVESAATSREEIGNPVYPPAKKILGMHGIRCDGHAARQITRKDYDEFDYIIGMEQFNVKNMKRIFGEDTSGKISLLRDYTDKPGDIADPWYSGDFETTYEQVLEGCKGLYAAIQ